jgi:hypothetical protein
MPLIPTRKSTGERRHLAEFQSATLVLDELRGRISDWETYASYWVAVDAYPYVISEQNAAVIYVVTAPFDTQIKVQHRVLIDTGTSTLRLKVIALVNPNLISHQIQLHCAEATDEE